MRFLCLHGKGTSGSIFKTQTDQDTSLVPDLTFPASFRPLLDPSKKISFDFIDAPFPSSPAAGVDVFYPPPYYAFWHGSSVKDIRASHRWLQELIAQRGPYDGVMMFSQGCSLISSYLLYHQLETPHLPLPFRVAVFICGGLSLPILEDLGIYVSQEAWDWDARSAVELQVKAASVATMRPGVERWISRDQMAWDPDAPVDESDVFGLDVSGVPSDVRIRIPTVHVFGSKDPRFPAAIQLAHLCDASRRRMFDHQGGHDIPRKKDVSRKIAELIEWSASMVDA
ncbi:MAG: hypothetical protein M1816_000688 [Peltula sp. TS41687]|nr:MAG: hypothetical protein M1816_000688 [Peltula sp. TS41687]